MTPSLTPQQAPAEFVKQLQSASDIIHILENLQKLFEHCKAHGESVNELWVDSGHQSLLKLPLATWLVDSASRNGAFRDNGQFSEKNLIAAVNLCVEQGVDLECRSGSFDCTLLHYAIAYNMPQLTAELLGHGADATAIDREGRSCLHWAVSSQNADLIEMLIAQGADPFQKNHEPPFLTPLQMARVSNNKRCIDKLTVIEQVLMEQRALEGATQFNQKHLGASFVKRI